MNRLDFIKISEWIEPNSKVLDLGCADGALLKYLQSKKNDCWLRHRNNSRKY